MREVTVKRYRCDFCPKGLASKSAMRKHESQCWKNPAAKSCGTCTNFEPFSYPDEPEYCAIEADNMDEWATGKPKPRQCPGWSANCSEKPNSSNSSPRCEGKTDGTQ